MRTREPIESMTTEQLVRAYDRLHERMRYGNGYQPFGYDWPTLRMTQPGIYNSMRRIRAEYARRHQS